MRQMLDANYRCLYLNSPVMVAGMSSYLAAHGVDVALEKAKSRLLLSSDQTRLSDGCFDPEQMIDKLEVAVVHAVTDGYKGLWEGPQAAKLIRKLHKRAFEHWAGREA